MQLPTETLVILIERFPVLNLLWSDDMQRRWWESFRWLYGQWKEIDQAP